MSWFKISKLLLFLYLHPPPTKANPFFQTKEGECACTFEGDPVLTMFDGKSYNLPPDPNRERRYTLAKDFTFKKWPCLFNVELKILPQEDLDIFSCRAQSVEGHLGFRGEFKIERGPEYVTIGRDQDKKKVEVPSNGSYIEVVANPSGRKEDHLVFKLWMADSFIWLESLNCTAFKIFYDRENRGGVVVDKEVHGMDVRGACGNCNGNEEDLEMFNGNLTTNIREFYESWLIS